MAKTFVGRSQALNQDALTAAADEVGTAVAELWAVVEAETSGLWVPR